MRKPLAVAALAALLPAVAVAQTADTAVVNKPGMVGAAQKSKLTATIKSVDAASRALTLTGPGGREASVIAGPEVANFAQLKAGDKVDVEFIEAVVVELRKGGGQPVARTEQGALETAKPGAKPGAVAGRMTTVVGDVIGVDASARTVTVRGPQRTVTLPVRNPEQFKLIAVGDQIEARYVEAAAVSVRLQK